MILVPHHSQEKAVLVRCYGIILPDKHFCASVCRWIRRNSIWQPKWQWRCCIANV